MGNLKQMQQQLQSFGLAGIAAYGECNEMPCAKVITQEGL
jgi:hypothetical protein